MRPALAVRVVLTTLPLSACLIGQATPTYVTSSENYAYGVMTYDQVRDRLVVGTASRALWEWDGTYWAKAQPELSHRPQAALYDAARGRVFFVSAPDLVEYDGHALIEHPLPGPANAPAVTSVTADTGRGRLVLIRPNGIIDTSVFEWDGSTWTPVSAPPTGRLMRTAAYDAARGVTVVMAAVPGTFPADETWEYDGSTWSMRLAGVDQRDAICYDPVGQRVISTGQVTKAWNGATWQQVGNGSALPLNGTLSTGADPAHQQLFGFSAIAAGNPIWSWDGSIWSQVLSGPYPQFGAFKSVHDPIRGRTVMLGDRHFEWDGASWFEYPTTAGPAFPITGVFAFDEARGEVVVVGGGTSTETWVWRNGSWRLAATNGPNTSYRPAICYDPVRQRVVLLGDGNSWAVQHWEWDGIAWTLVAASTPVGSPGVAGYDRVRSRLVVVDSSLHTSEYDGTSWTTLQSGSPLGTEIVWDVVRQALQMNDGGQRYEWTGTGWQWRFASSGQLAYDVRRNAMLVVDYNSLRTETTQPATATDYGSGCGGATTITSLTAFGRPRIGDPAGHIDLRAEAALQPALIAFAFATANVSIGNGCTLLLQNPAAVSLQLTNANGCVHHPMPVPAYLGLVGVTIHAQGAVLDPASPGGFGLTQGLTLVLGH
ncbi:MAG: hypothetical protein KDC98_09225 [Planctomycetes bacterium]|nr:hypothetical protein [Planctomycetota bacterium]